MRFPKRKTPRPPASSYWKWKGLSIPSALKRKTLLKSKTIRRAFIKLNREGYAMIDVDREDSRLLDLKIAMEHEEGHAEPKYLTTYINRPRPHKQIMVLVLNKPKKGKHAK